MLVKIKQNILIISAGHLRLDFKDIILIIIIIFLLQIYLPRGQYIYLERQQEDTSPRN